MHNMHRLERERKGIKIYQKWILVAVINIAAPLVPSLVRALNVNEILITDLSLRQFNFWRFISLSIFCFFISTLKPHCRHFLLASSDNQDLHSSYQTFLFFLFFLLPFVHFLAGSCMFEFLKFFIASHSRNY